MTQPTTSSRHSTRDKSKNVNYSVFFEDFDYLSEEEENKKKSKAPPPIKKLLI